MATSKNRRKNGKAVKPSIHKRVRRNGEYLVKDLMVCSAVDRQELDDHSKQIAQTVVYDRRAERILPFISTAQEHALKRERWKWNIHTGVICRGQDGIVYFDNEKNVVTVTEVMLGEMNDYIADTLIEAYSEADPMDVLTMFWIATPYEMGDPPVQAALAPIWKHNVLGNMLTKFETENPQHLVTHYKAKDLEAFCLWFVTQEEHQIELEKILTFKMWWEKTGIPMRAGELKSFRQRMIDAGIEEIDGVFNPLATVAGFVKYGKREYRITGKGFSKISAVLDTVPKCLDCYLDIVYSDGREQQLRFTHEDR